MAFPETSIIDDFNRDNEGPPLSSDWTEIGYAAGGLKVSNNECAPEDAGSCLEYYNVSTYGPNCEVYVTDRYNFAKNAVLIRLQSPDTAETDGYILEADIFEDPDILKLSRLDDGVRTLLGASIEQVLDGDDKFGIESVGDTHTIYYDDGGAGWGSLGSRTDSTYPDAGYLGLKIYGTASGALDDFGGGTLAGGPDLNVAIVESDPAQWKTGVKIVG